jgi:prepilin-type N-terminal cleavage/methylation domain-containing protein/prepilin-type processing-associated H-X9-DG protein
MRRKLSRLGFTLIELLIVIAIVSMLAAILMPVFAQVREKARRTTCLSNENQIGIAFLQYTQDNDERFPNGINPTGGPFWAGEGWAGQCLSYFHATALLHCPDDKTQSITSHDTAISYGYNINLVEPGEDEEYALFGYTEGGSPPGRSLAALNAPPHSVLLFEVSGVTAAVTEPLEGGLGASSGRYFSASGNGLDHRLYAHKDVRSGLDNQYATGYLGTRTPPDPAQTQFTPATGRHGGGSNFLLADGHVRWLRGARVSSGLNASSESCHQGNQPFLPGCDNGVGAYTASGTGTSDFDATFSIR